MRPICVFVSLRNAGAPLRRSRRKRPRASIGDALYGAVAGALTGGVLGPLLALLVARLSYGPFACQDFAANVAVRAGCSAGCVCGLLLGAATPFLRRRALALLLATGIGAVTGAIYAWLFGFS